MKSPFNKFSKEELSKPLNLYYKIYLIGILLLPVPMLYLSISLEEGHWIQDKLFIIPIIYVLIGSIYFMLKHDGNIFKNK